MVTYATRQDQVRAITRLLQNMSFDEIVKRTGRKDLIKYMPVQRDDVTFKLICQNTFKVKYFDIYDDITDEIWSDDNPG